MLADGFGIRADVEPSTKAEPPLSGKRPVSILDDGGFSAAVGAEEPEDFAFFDAEADVVDGGEVAETPNQMFGGDGGLRESLRVGRHSSALGFQFHVRGHAGEDATGGIIDADFYANDLVDALFAGLHIARQEFGCWLICSTRPSKAVFGKESTPNFPLFGRA